MDRRTRARLDQACRLAERARKKHQRTSRAPSLAFQLVPKVVERFTDFTSTLAEPFLNVPFRLVSNPLIVQLLVVQHLACSLLQVAFDLLATAFGFVAIHGNSLRPHRFQFPVRHPYSLRSRGSRFAVRCSGLGARGSGRVGAMAYVETETGRIYYCRDGRGPAVLLIQGVGVVGNGWKPQVEGLKDGFTLISIDNRGIGRSTCKHAPTIEDMAADALGVADAEGVERFHLVGHSMGGVIAQQIALTATSRVASLALLCTFLKGRQGTMIAPSMLGTAIRSRIGTRRMRRRAFVELVMPRDYLAAQDRDRLCADLGALFGRDLADQPPIIMQQLKAMRRYDASARLAVLRSIPTLVMSAEHDHIARPRYGRALAAAIPGARYVEIPGAGHAVVIQKADEVNGLLREHLASPTRHP